MFLIRRLSVQSRLVVLLLFASISSILVVGFVAYASANEALTQWTFSRLDGLRRSRAVRIRDRIDLIRNQVITFSETESIIQATREFRLAYAKLQKSQLSNEQQARLRAYYERQFLPELARNTDGEPVLDTYLPTRPTACYLQYHYLVANPHSIGGKAKLDAASDGSEYSEVHRKHHPYFRSCAERFRFKDVLLVNPDTGDVLYTSEKTTELGRSLYSGPYAQSNLANLVRSLRKHGDRKTFRIADFEPYLPNVGQPAAFVASPIFDGPKRIGILVLQFPIETINRIVTGNNNWERNGLGQSGEVFVAGPDHLLRSTTRHILQDVEGYCRTLRKAGYAPATVARIEHLKTPILLQSVRNKAVEEALLGEKGTEILPDYRGVQTLCSYGPLKIDGLHWVIIAKLDVAEAYAPVYALGRRILLVLVVVALVVSVLAVFLARLYVRPIQQISEGVRAVSAGQTGVIVQIDSEDEFRELADAFNDLTRSLQSKNDLLDQKIRENEDLLLNVLPGPTAARVREAGSLRALGQQTPDTYADVTVLFAELTGYAALDIQLPSGEDVGLVNELLCAFDELTERFGVEKLRTTGMTYLAVCGLSVARVDHANRIVEFAQEMLRVVHRFNQDRGTSLALHVGISSGPVVGSIIGRGKFSYELWGATVNVASRLCGGGQPDTIQISLAVQERLRDLYEFERQPEIQFEQDSIAVWSIKSAA